MHEDHPCLEKRVRRLETTIRSLALVGLIAIAATWSGVAWTDNPEPQILRAEKFELVDAQGKIRAELLLQDGQPALLLRDGEGRERIHLGHDSDQTALFIKDEAEDTRVGVAFFAHGGGGFALHGPEGKGAAVLYLKGKGSLSFYDPEGKKTLQIPAPDAKP